MFLLLAMAFGVRVSWAGKSQLFKWPYGWITRALHGIPVDRSGRHDMVTQLAGEFRAREKLYLAIAPEGTRKRTEYWKSGFYHLAIAAKVPVVCGIIDYGKKEGGWGPVIPMTGDVRADMDKIRAVYTGVTPLRPENLGPMRLRSEEQSEF